MRSEADFRSLMTRRLRNLGAHVQPIESGSTGDGIPDIYISHEGMGVWMELKKADVVAQTVRIKYRPGQRAWLEAEKKAGRLAVLGVYLPADDCYYFLHSNFCEYYPYPFTAWNLKLPTLACDKLLEWLLLLESTKRGIEEQ